MDSKKFKKLPPEIAQAWWYGGKNGSVHIILKPVCKELYFKNGFTVSVTSEIPQINLEFSNKKRKKP